MNTPSPILGPSGQPIEASKPQTMKELLDQAQENWKFKRRDQAFVDLLNAMAMMSHGVAQSMKTIELLSKQKEELSEQVQSLREIILGPVEAVDSAQTTEPVAKSVN